MASKPKEVGIKFKTVRAFKKSHPRGFLKEIAEEYGVSQGLVSRILRGHRGGELGSNATKVRSYLIELGAPIES